MADSAHSTRAGAQPARRPVSAPTPCAPGGGTGLLALVAALFTTAQLLLVHPSMGLGWDETVYVSQVSGHAPASYFSAPRARGVSLLVAPVASWSSSTVLLRVYLAVLSGAALWLALRAWRGLFPVRVLAAAGALFAGLWVTLFYAPQAMPNYWVATGGLACAGCFLRARADPADRWAWWGMAGSAALTALMRPTDAVWTTAPLLVLAAATRRWRALAFLAAGLAAGAAEWVIEAYADYGGLGRRLADGSRLQGGLGLHFAVDDQLRSLDGRTLCRPCDVPAPHPAVTLWWFALPLLAAAGLAVAVRAGRTVPTLVALACAVTAAVPYLFLIEYAAPRFLLPAYALLALPVADALLRPVTGPRGRPLLAAAVAVALAGHLAVQYAVVRATVARTTEQHRAWSRTAAELHRLGVRPPCLLTGHEALPIGYYAGCSSAATSGPNANATEAGITATARRVPTAHLTTRDGAPAAYARTWQPHPFAGLRIYVANRARLRISRRAGPGSGPAAPGPGRRPGPVPRPTARR
ncbi:hypothetical protein [Streptomyces sp. Ru71]|uniref:hypothetical protein n=1 Tax=Streptomyces sp. Ru71 TaxID=2080746 RepID=UPI0021564D71|nr:hypothetical protein [Streptomyces sp. Ru71]